MVIAMLIVIPISRIVSIMPEARPNISFCTELTLVRTSGDWQKATPAPMNDRARMMNRIEEMLSRKAHRIRPAEESSMPAPITIRGAIRSDNLPAKGESSVMNRMGVSSKIPAILASKPLISCR